MRLLKRFIEDWKLFFDTGVIVLMALFLKGDVNRHDYGQAALTAVSAMFWIIEYHTDKLISDRKREQEQEEIMVRILKEDGEPFES